MRLKDKGIYLEAKDREWEIGDFVDFPCDMWNQDERNEREPYDDYEWEEYELRAWVEKRRHYAQMGREWDQTRSELNRCCMFAQACCMLLLHALKRCNHFNACQACWSAFHVTRQQGDLMLLLQC